MREHDEFGPGPMLRRGDVINNTIHEAPDKYRVLEFIGKGGFGECYAAESVSMKSYVALKVVNKSRLKDRMYQKIYREINIHRLAHHQHIVRLYDAFQDVNNFYIVLELCRVNSLLNLINEEHSKKRMFDEVIGSRYVNQICDAIIYLAKKSILHRDIKPGNVFIAQNGDVKLGDFGLATKIEDLTPGSVSGTPNYLAPEVIAKEGHSLASEIWSLGCLIYCMLVGKPPFESDTVEATYDRIRSGQYSYPTTPEVSASAREVISDCLISNPYDRVPIYWITDMKWLQETRDGNQTLTRAKSTGNIYSKDINANHQGTPSRHLRPKSAMNLNASINNRVSSLTKMFKNVSTNPSRRKSITASHDSGFGSETDMLRTQSVAFYNMMEKLGQYIADLKSVENGQYILKPSCMPPVAVSKWVDYTNRRGFGCKLTDGTLAVKFNEGVCISWPQNSPFLLYLTSPYVPPRILRPEGEESLSQVEYDNIEVAKEYADYMDRELQGIDLETDCSPKPIEDAIYIAHHYLDNKHVMVVFNTGLMQVTLLETKVKLILWKEDDQRYMGITILTKDNPPASYRVVPANCREIFCTDKSMVPLGMSVKTYDYFSEVTSYIEKGLPLISNIHRTVQVTSC